MDLLSMLKVLRFLTPVYEPEVFPEVKLHVVNNSMCGKDLFERMMQFKSIEVIAPDATLANMMNLQRDFHKQLKQHYYGTEVSPKDVFGGCKTPVEAFFLKQEIEHELLMHQHRFGFVATDNGLPVMNLKDLPEIPSITKAIIQNSEPGKLVFVSLRIMSMHLNVDHWFRRGVDISALGRNRIRPMVDVWSPTYQDYINMLDVYLKEQPMTGEALDIGSGTGVLSILLALRGLKVTAIDSSLAAVECTRLNARNAGLPISVVHGDICDPLALQKFDLLVCNPPWLPTKATQLLLQGLFDQDERMLKGSIRFAGQNLRATGRLLLVYSDLAALIGLQPKNRIEQLCEENGLRIVAIIKNRNLRHVDSLDPLASFKQASHFLLYDIRQK